MEPSVKISISAFLRLPAKRQQIVLINLKKWTSSNLVEKKQCWLMKDEKGYHNACLIGGLSYLSVDQPNKLVEDFSDFLRGSQRTYDDVCRYFARCIKLPLSVVKELSNAYDEGDITVKSLVNFVEMCQRSVI